MTLAALANDPFGKNLTMLLGGLGLVGLAVWTLTSHDARLGASEADLRLWAENDVATEELRRELAEGRAAQRAEQEAARAEFARMKSDGSDEADFQAFSMTSPRRWPAPR